MVLELHVWGPAFSLPSVDPQCLAAIAYLSQAVPRAEWVLVASSDPSLSPTNELPALRNDNVWIGGFRNIVDYVSQLSNGNWSLDVDLEGIEKADCIAFSSYIESRGQELLDLSLYVSSQNYTSITRPLYNTIQSFPLPYLTPPSLRSAAKARTAHLGLSSLDVDTSAEPKQEPSIIPQALRPKSLSNLLSNPENASQIRLDAIATSFLGTLQDLRDKKRWFIGGTPTSLDCLALGYLSLALLPDLPSPWLANCMRKKFPKLCAFVHDASKAFYGGSVSLEDAGLGKPTEADRRAAGKGKLPWKVPEQASIVGLAGAFGSSLVDSLPIVSHFREHARFSSQSEMEAEDEREKAEVAEIATMHKMELITTLGSIVAGVGFFVGFLFYHGVIAIGSSDEAQENAGWQSAQTGGNSQHEEAPEALDILMGALGGGGGYSGDGRTFSGNSTNEGANVEVFEDAGGAVEVNVEVIPDRSM